MNCPHCAKYISDTASFCSGCGKRLMSSSEEGTNLLMVAKPEHNKIVLEPDDVLMNRYQIKASLKRGGMGAIYEVYDIRLKRSWALKEMIELFSNDDDRRLARERFEREATMLASLIHPNLPRVIDYFEENSRFYLVMDFITGEDLQDVINRHPYRKLPEDMVLNLARDILKILDYLHSLNPPVVYRDIKPSNIMIRESDGKTMLIDFGIARAIAADEGKKTEIGTVGYAPPEQYAGHPQPVSDIYALGATMHELLTGSPPRVPFQFERIKDLAPEISAITQEIIETALRLEPEKRWCSALSMLEALNSAAEPSPAPPGKGFFRIEPGASFSVEIPASTRSIPGDLPGLDTKTISSVPFAFRDTSTASLPGDAPLHSIHQPPEAQARPAVSPEKEQTLQRLHDYSEKFKDRKTLEGHRSMINMIAYHPHDEVVASGSMDSTVKLWNLVTGTEIKSYSEMMSNITSLSFSSDGRHMAYTSASDRMKIVDLVRHISITEFDKVNASITALMYQPNELIVNIGCTDGDLIVYNYATQNYIRPKYNKIPITCLAVSGDGSHLVTGHRDGTVTLWETATKKMVTFAKMQEGQIKCLAFSPNNRILASGSVDGTVGIWSIPKLAAVKSLKGNAGEVYALDFAPDKPYILTASGDNTFRIWDLPDGELNVFFQEKLGRITSMAFKVYPQSTWFAASTYGGIIHCWKL